MSNKSAKSVAYSHLCRPYNIISRTFSILFRKNEPRVDRRTKFGKEVIAEYYKAFSAVNRTEVRKKQEERRKHKVMPPVNILQSPIVLDWMKNKHRLYVKSDRLTDGYRNHWAKDERDVRILAILRKYSTKNVNK